jgi:uncharacterized phage protein (TIGR02220 family)
MQERVDHFTFYKNYYDIIKYLNEKDKLLIINAIFEYMFEDKEPNLEGLISGIWSNIKMPLETTKKKVINGKKGGAPKGNINAKKQAKNKQKTSKGTTKKQANNISVSVSVSNSVSISNRVINKLNELNNSKYKYNSEETLKLIRGRLDEGYTEDDLMLVVEKMSYLWNKEPSKNEKDMRPYLRPSTLFRKSNFENYLNMPTNKTRDLRDVKEVDVMEVFR